MNKYLSLALVLALAACGADGAPVAPAAKPAMKPGISVSGDAQIGVLVQNP